MNKKRIRINSPCFSHCKAFKGKGQFLIACIGLFLLASCSGQAVIQEKKEPISYVGAVLPEIKSSGEKILKNGGNAVDAVAGMLMTQAVHLPSRAGLGAGGVCQVFSPSEKKVKTLNFLPAPMGEGIGVPALARGIFSLQNNYGIYRWADILSDAQKSAQNGITVSELLAEDTRKIAFLELEEGAVLKQEKLAQTLKKMMTSGSGILYKGDYADKITKNRNVDTTTLSGFKAKWSDSIEVSSKMGNTYFPNLAVFGSNAYTIWEDLSSDSETKRQRAFTELKNIDEKTVYLGESVYGASVMATDTDGLTVICSVTNGNLFGTGKEVGSLGFYLAEPLDETKMSATLVNLIQTDTKKEEPVSMLSAVGDYVVRDAVLLSRENILNGKTVRQSIASAQKQLPDDRRQVLNQSPVLSCFGGTISYAGNCRHNDIVTPFKKEVK
ncbi:MAG: gamma-glutamyltransferase [Alphaproteobacteria bacterium]|nr:gamma-glutamyltransferase [Alphaproteobacteria bacterium]